MTGIFLFPGESLQGCNEGFTDRIHQALEANWLPR
jgi:hypothetical protein